MEGQWRLAGRCCRFRSRVTHSIALTRADGSERQTPFCVEKQQFTKRFLVFRATLIGRLAKTNTIHSYLVSCQQLKGITRA